MTWKVHSEEKDHFVIHGSSGPFRIGKQNLSDGGLVRMRASLGKKKASAQADEPVKGYANGTPDGPVENADFPSKETANPAVPLYETEGSAPRPAPTPAPAANPPPETTVEPSTGAITTSLPPDEGSRQWGRIFSTENPAHEAFLREQQAQKPAEPPPDSLAVRPGEPGGPPMPPQASSQQTSQGFSMPSMPPTTDLSRVAQDSAEAQRRGGVAADTLQKAESQQAAAMTGLYQEHIANVKALNDKTTAELQSIQARNDKMLSDLQDPKSDIKPEHFWAEKSTFQKVVAGLGMVLSGIGSGLTGQPNMAAAFIQKAIERDIEAQKANLGKKESALSYGMKLYGNHVMAADYARSMLTNTLAAQVGMEGARSGDLRARAQAEMTKSQLAQQALGPQLQIAQIRHQDAMMRYQMEFQRRLFEMAGGGGQQQGNYIPSSAHPPMLTEFSPKGIADRNKDDNERRVNLPSVERGAYTHAQTPKDAEEVKATLGSLDNMEKQLGTLSDTATDHSVMVQLPYTQAHAKYETFRSSMLTEMNKLQGLNRLNDDEFKSYNNAIPSEHEWITGAGQAKADSMKQLIENKRQEEYQQKLGLHQRAPQKPKRFEPIAGAR